MEISAQILFYQYSLLYDDSFALNELHIEDSIRAFRKFFVSNELKLEYIVCVCEDSSFKIVMGKKPFCSINYKFVFHKFNSFELCKHVLSFIFF